jgi:ABC-2 type transport system ATP-binding protein
LSTDLEYAVVADSLSKSYGRVRALVNVSFKVKKGELYAILGPNGAGKTTTVKSLVGGVRLDGGSLFILGHDVVKESLVVKSLVGVMSELPGLFPELTVKQNLRLIGKLYGLRGRELEERVDELIDFMDLSKHAEKRYYSLSKGLKRRADLLAALIHDPEILILDEPMSGIDIMSRDIIMRKLDELVKNGKTVILTTHNIGEAMEIAHRVLVLAQGRVVAVGSPAELRGMVSSEQVIEVLLNEVPSDLVEGLKRELKLKEVDVRGKALRFQYEDVMKALKILVEVTSSHSVQIISVVTNPVSWDKVLLKLTSRST